MESAWTIPVVDISPLNLHRDSVDFTGSEILKCAQKFVKALEEYGVVHLINHGVEESKLQKVRELGRRFLALPMDQKMKAYRPAHDISNGFLGKAMEYSGGKGVVKGDFKESFNFSPPTADDFPWPDDETLPGFRQTNKDFFWDCLHLGKRLIKLLDLCYPSPEGQNIIEKAHTNLGTAGNRSQGKYLLYPPMSEEEMEKFDRIGEHTDWGTFTLLFQDSTGGLEVRDRHGEAHSADPVEGAILIQAADMLERWTSGKIRSMPHFVSASEATRHRTRESAVFFVAPDEDCIVRCIDGSDSYPSCRYGDYQVMKSIEFQGEDDKLLETTSR